MHAALSAAWLAKLLETQRPLVNQHLIATVMLRLRQFAHLRSSLPMRLRLAALLSFTIFPENEVIIREGYYP